MPRINQIQVRRDTAANWTSVDPVLAAGEMGLETDTRKTKFGDGTTGWTSLAYATSAGLISSDTAPDSPSVGAQWFNSSTGKTYVYYDGYWVELDSNGTSATSTGNAIINGGFDIFQRGTFASRTTSGYSLDRWYAGTGGTVTVSQQTTGVPVGSSFCMRATYNANSSFANFYQAFESIEANKLAGKTVTLSAKLRKNATFATDIEVQLEKNATANTLIGGTWSTLDGVVVANSSLPTGTTSEDWYFVSFTTTVPNDGSAAGLRVRFGEEAVGVSGAYYEIAEVQLEEGPVATPFKRNANSFQGELAACQRYYYRNNGAAYWANGGNRSTTQADFLMQYPVTMRTAPTALEQNGTAGSYSVRHGNTNTTCSAVPTFNGASVDAAVFTFTVASGLTLGQAAFARNLSGYLAWSAEL